MQPSFECECVYHVYNHANGFENLFQEDDNYRYFLKKYGEHLHPVVETFAYCLMPNHFHLLVRVRNEAELKAFKDQKDLTGLQNLSGLNLERLVSQQFSNFFNAYTKAYNKMFDRQGSLFRRPVKRKKVETDAYYTRLIHYIHHNPVHHGFVADFSDWQHSSYEALLSEKNTLLNRQETISWFGDKRAFQDFHCQPTDPKLALEMEFI